MLGMRKIALVGALGVAALGLVGMGTGASFTDSVSAGQKVTAGHMNMQISSSETGATSNGKSVSFADLGPVGSTFTSGVEKATITNSGNVAVDAWLVKINHTEVGAAAPSKALADQLYVRVTSGGPSNVIFNGKLRDFEANPVRVTGPLAPTGTDPMEVEFYAGNNGAVSLNNDAQDGQIIPTVTVDYIG